MNSIETNRNQSKIHSVNQLKRIQNPKSKPKFVTLGDDTEIPILYEDRSVLALDKPEGWMLVPHSWQRTARNLQAAIVSSIGAGQFWARSRQLRFLRYVHRLDAETTGVLLFAKSPGALETYGALFESRRMEKEYLAIVQGTPPEREWICRAKLDRDSRQFGRMRVEARAGKEAETRFTVRGRKGGTTLVAAYPLTGRTHQIRVHLATGGHPVLGDPMYGAGGQASSGREPKAMALRAVRLAYVDPFTRRRVEIRAPVDMFLKQFGFGGVSDGPEPQPATD
jgi:RluA family pseudouridine synthase